MNREQRNKIGYISDLLFFIILPLIWILTYVFKQEDTSEQLEFGYDVFRGIVVVIEIIGIVFITRRKRNPEYTSLEERREFEVQVSNELDIVEALLSNMFIVFTSVGAGALWYYSYVYLENMYLLLMCGAFIISLFIFSYCGNKLYKANMKSKTIFWAGFLCSFISVMSFLAGTVTYLGKDKMWLLIITIAIIFLFLGVGYFISSYKIRKENKKVTF
jgi:hypothetical protein